MDHIPNLRAAFPYMQPQFPQVGRAEFFPQDTCFSFRWLVITIYNTYKTCLSRTILADYRPVLAMIDAHVYIMQYPVAISNKRYMV